MYAFKDAKRWYIPSRGIVFSVKNPDTTNDFNNLINMPVMINDEIWMVTSVEGRGLPPFEKDIDISLVVRELTLEEEIRDINSLIISGAIKNGIVGEISFFLTGEEIDTLIGLVENGPLWDGDIPSKTARDILIFKELAVRVVVKGEDGFTAATYAGKDKYKELFNNADTIAQAKAIRIAQKNSVIS